ncbi:hypothetical protein D3C78_1826360 [compost metagenome]
MLEPEDLAALQADRAIDARDVAAVLAALPAAVAELAVLHDGLLALGQGSEQPANDPVAQEDSGHAAKITRTHSASLKR